VGLSQDAARDIGVSPGKLRQSATKKCYVPDRMQRMLRIFGAGAALADANRYQALDMARTCDRCAERGICAMVLDGDKTPSDEDVDFYPNAEDYREMTNAKDSAGKA
jgi:hypothetical protein